MPERTNMTGRDNVQGRQDSEPGRQDGIQDRQAPGAFRGGPGGIGRGGFGGAGRGGGGARWAMPVVKPKDLKGTLARIWKYFGKEQRFFIVILVLTALNTGLGLAGPYLVGKAIDAMAPGKLAVDFTALGMMATALLAAYITEAVIAFSQEWIMAGVSQRIVQNLRNTLFDKLQKLPIAFFDTRTHGDLMSRLSNDIDNISSVISQSTTQLMASALSISGSLAMMLVLSPILTLAGMVTVPMVFLVTRTIAGKTRTLFKEQQKELGKLNGHIEEAISGIYVVKAFNHEEKSIKCFDEINESLCEVGIKAQIWSGFIMPLLNVINNIGFAAVAGVGGILATKGVITVGVIASFLSYTRQFVRPLNNVANIFNAMQTAVAGAERVFEIMDETAEPEDAPGAIPAVNPRGHVVFEHVNFGYRPDIPVIKDISFDVKEGATIALAGPTGAGKTTIVNLLTRFYDVSEGRILLDGRDIREYTRDSLRSCFGIVLQDTYLFQGTIRENIKYGRPDASDEEMEKAAAMANADIFIKRLPEGYDTVITESGSSLSQGQRQLIAIARTILADPSILILDEATSNVDTRTELHIQQAMIKLMEGRTSFIIAHRLSTIRHADEIMVVDRGRIVEKGRHKELLSLKGKYYRMYFGLNG